MRVCTCQCDCKNEFEEISDQSLALLIALSERKIPHDRTICNGCRYGKHRKRRLGTKPISLEI